MSTNPDVARSVFIRCEEIQGNPDYLYCMNGADWRDKRGRAYCRYHVRRAVGRDWRKECTPVPPPHVDDEATKLTKNRRGTQPERAGTQ